MTGVPRATVHSGQLAGTWDGGVAVFRGIPFAAPPIGPDRWRPPRPRAPWEGVRPATRFGPAPVQPQPPRDSIMFQANFADRHELVMSEDCLYLNVWTPDPSPVPALPVLVWVHGGGNRYGHGSQDLYDGRALAGRGLVVVTLNYRLGALGFLAHPGLSAEDDEDTSGNYGLLDVVAALEWVRRDIHAFGGDPERVTLAGNSAGAAHVCHLMAAPRARGLFGRAIGHGAAGVGRAEGPLPALREAEEHGERVALRSGDPSLARLRSRSAVELATTGHFGPIADGALLERDTAQVFAAGEQAKVALLVGTNRDEGSHFVTPGTEIPGELRDAYPAADPCSARHWTGDTRFVWPVWRWACLHDAPVWMYRFHRHPPLPTGLELTPPSDGVPAYGCFHTAELPYVFDNLAALPWPWLECDRALARTMAGTWARFATAADPNGGELPPWPRFSPAHPQVLHFAERTRTGAPDRLPALRLLDDRRPRAETRRR